jgi:phenylpropionate dioxygenase-like ring-hydroxylating dioxygenase large terminal subunit
VTSRGPLTYQQVLEADGEPAPPELAPHDGERLGPTSVPVEGYTSRRAHELERERLWPRVWQMACREEHIPDVGDHVVYDIAGRSYLLIRAAPGEIRAFPNACLHRGRQLKTYAGRCDEIRCPFHGFTWHLDGRLKRVPAPWEFPHVEAETMSLPEVQVGTWAGFVFINPDPDAPPLADWLGVVPAHFRRWAYDDRYVEVHVAKIVRANWKVAQEAFMESLHVASTHPQVAAYSGDLATQVDTWDTVSRMITPSEVTSPQLAETADDETKLRATFDVRIDEDLAFHPAEGQTARQAIAAATRDQWRTLIGDRIDGWSPADLVDNFVYTVFPNLHPWGGVHKICYRFRPNGDDHRSSIMEVLVLTPVQGERPPPAPLRWLEDHEAWSDAPELGMLGKVFDQDMTNMEGVQRGLESTARTDLVLAGYQENKLRWFYARLDQMLGEH